MSSSPFSAETPAENRRSGASMSSGFEPARRADGARVRLRLQEDSMVNIWFAGWQLTGRIVSVGSIGYAVLVFLLRISGERTLAQMNSFNFVITVAIGATFGRVMTTRSVALAEAVLPSPCSSRCSSSWRSRRPSTAFRSWTLPSSQPARRSSRNGAGTSPRWSVLRPGRGRTASRNAKLDAGRTGLMRAIVG